MTHKAYQTTQNSTETASQTEYRLFTDVTRALMDVKGADLLDQKLHDALHWNRQMWSAYATDCAVEGNQLPKALRAQIISISIFVGKHSSLVARGQEDIQSLIDINRNIMEGLALQAENQRKLMEQQSQNAPSGAAVPSQGTSHTV